MVLATSLVVLVAVGCGGDGSDIGPRLPPIPEESSKVILLDDQNRGVVSGRVEIVGTNVSALTGRNGRGDFLAAPGGRLVFDAIGSPGAATAGDRLADLCVALTVVGADLPTPIHLPDLPDASSSTVASGLQAATTVLTSTSGDSILTVATGTEVSDAGSPSSVTLRIGELSPQHLPGDLPLSGSGTVLYGHGLYVDPPTATFAPGLDIDMVDDLGLGSNVASLYRMDPVTGEWAIVSTATAAGGRIARLGAITTGGLYAFGVAVDYAAVAGRVLDVDGVPLPETMVRVDQRHTTTLGDGTYQVDFVARTEGDGVTGREAVIEVFAGGWWLPVVVATTVPLNSATVDAGDIVLDTERAGNLRIQQIVRARADPFRPARFSSLIGEVSLVTTSDAAGQLLFEDVPAEYFGFVEGRPIDTNDLYYGQVIGFLEPGRRWSDVNQFLARRPWFVGSRSTRAFACDAFGGGPVYEAAIIRGTEPDGLVAITNENGSGTTDRDFRGRASASVRSERDGKSITHAKTVIMPNSDLLEFPLLRVLRRPLGAFDRHGLVAGNLTEANPTADFGLRVSRRITREEWWDAVVEGDPIESSLPIDVDPATSGDGSFQAGIAAAGGHLAAVEIADVGGEVALQRLGLLADFTPDEAALIERDVPLNAVADTDFVLVDAAATASSLVGLNDLDLALGFELANGQLVDVARDLAGSLAADAADLRLTLPALTGDLAGGQWLALISGSTVDSGSTASHASLIPVSEVATTGFAFPDFPTLTPPTSPSASGFTVDFTLPSGVVAGRVELRSNDDPDDLLLWQAFVPPDATTFEFSTMPVDADTPLLAGRTYTLSVTAFFGPANEPPPRPYIQFTAFTRSVGIVGTGVTRIARRSIIINT